MSASASMAEQGAANKTAGRVSVIIPCYNQARYLGACIDSVFGQQLADCEIIVVNDGSTDDTERCARSFGERITYIAQANRGLSNARNTGLAHASGEYVQFLDSDDLLAPGAILARRRTLESSGADIAVCPNRLFSVTDERQRPRVSGQWRLATGSFAVHLCYANLAPPHAYLLRRATVLSTGLFDETLRACEDYDYVLRAVVGGARLVRCAEALVYYRRHPHSMSANLGNQYQHDIILHGRLRELLLVTRHYPQQRLTAKLLAYMAGLALSLTRREQLTPESVQRVCAYLDEAGEILLERQPERDFHAGYYAALLARRLRATGRVEREPALRGAVERGLAVARRHADHIAALWRGGEGVSLYERARLARMLLAR